MEEFINNNTIVKDEIYNAFKESVICPICSSILINPLICMKCQKVFCERCINDWSKKEKDCPSKCKEPKYQKCVGKKDILSKLTFKCKACGKIYNYDRAISHLKKCYPNKKFPEEEQENVKSKSKFEKLTREEVEKLKSEGNEVTYITGKKKLI
jgi:hypothetical protein